ncbi:MAG: helix-turn-helix domain-containing protein [Solirubrobacterales bacterium]|nr:helix-turn-helix domain-containing protein [Solirubrobacterales bacterium]
MTDARDRAQRARRQELATFLRARRAQLQPADVGLPDQGPRRTPGLRREEVAELARVSDTWYTWLEQARNISPSAQVIDALGRALLLGADEQRHLRELSGHTPPRGRTRSDSALPRLRRLVDGLAPNVASVYDMHYDYLAWNQPYVRVRMDPGRLPDNRRNLLWMMFTHTENRARMVRWEPAARNVLSQFRAAAGRHPDDPRFAELTAALTDASSEFAAWWTEYPVWDFRPTTIEIAHPADGRVALELFQFRLVESPDLLLVLQVPATPARPATGHKADKPTPNRLSRSHQ